MSHSYVDRQTPFVHTFLLLVLIPSVAPSKSTKLIDAVLFPPDLLYAPNKPTVSYVLLTGTASWSKQTCCDLFTVADRDIESSMAQLGVLGERVAMYKPKLIKQLMCHNCETKELAVVDVAHWKRVVDGLYMSDQQKSELLEARHRYLAAVGEVLTDRKKIQVGCVGGVFVWVRWGGHNGVWGSGGWGC